MRAYIQCVHTRAPLQKSPRRLAARRNNVLSLCEEWGIDPTTTALGALIGVDHSQVSRVLAGTSRPGNRFIAGMVDLFGADKFLDLFEILPDDGGAE